jgi:hypothetical protein
MSESGGRPNIIEASKKASCKDWFQNTQKDQKSQEDSWELSKHGVLRKRENERIWSSDSDASGSERGTYTEKGKQTATK